MQIPFLNTPDKALSDTTQNFLPIADITDNLVLSREGGAAVVMETTSLNFGLLSEKEQEAVIAAYAAIINSLSFSIQIVVRTQRKDISNYLNFVSEAEKKINNPKLAHYLTSYKQFIIDSIKKKNVLGKKFYVVIPFSPLELGLTKSVLTVFRTKSTLPFPKSYVIKKSKIVLYPRRDHLIRQAGRLGIRLRQLTTNELMELYYWTFNPLTPAVRKEK